MSLSALSCSFHLNSRPVQDTFNKYLDTDTFKILSQKVSRYRYFKDTFSKKYLDTDTFKRNSHGQKINREMGMQCAGQKHLMDKIKTLFLS